jgi:hypothetical protein
MADSHPIKLCECGCGQPTKICTHTRSKYGHVAGQQLRFINGHNSRTHRMSFTRTYKIWTDMLDRCRNQAHHAYASYGGRGITVCVRWMSFENFLSDMGEKPENKSLDRVENDGPYEKNNCRWATAAQQMNNRRGTIIIAYEGINLPLSEWAKRLGFSYSGLFCRYTKGEKPPYLFRARETRYLRKR